jgi:hypothetical protein
LALVELAKVFAMIAKAYRQKGQALPADSTEIINTWRHGAGFSTRRPPIRLHS